MQRRTERLDWRAGLRALHLLRGRMLLALLALGVLAADRLWPLPVPQADGGVVVLARDGSPLRTYPAAGGIWRYPVRPDQVSPRYVEALLGYEDRWFYYHPGVNPVALLRAAWQWLRSGEVVSGGSTLTMQVARLLEPVPRTPSGKLRQMVRALQLELHYSKREILTLYLNRAPMGGVVEGVEMAARSYLGKSSRELSHGEAALLAALPQAPSRLRPDRAPWAATRARDKVLARLAAHRVWPAAVAADARIERVLALPLRAPRLAPLAAERLRQALAGPTTEARGPGIRQVIHSTLDPDLQTTLERLLLDRAGVLPPRVSIAALVIDVRSLEVLAYAGSADFDDEARYAHVDMVRAQRSPGSTLKPFLYGLALERGLIHSESLLVDAPQRFGDYAPGNFQAAFSGPVSAAEALQRSLNVPAVDLLDRLGSASFASALAAGGLRLRLPAGAQPNLSLILGGAGVNLESLVGAYRALAAGGLAGRPRLTAQAPREELRLLSPGAAWIVRDILEGGGHPDRPFVEQGGVTRLAWKTGTSFGFRDAWALGVTDDYALGVWVGRPDGTPNPGYFGASAAAPLLRALADALPRRGTARAPRPAAVGVARICWPLGLAQAQTPPGLCHQVRTAWTLDGAVPPTLDDRVRPGSLRETAWFDQDGLRVRPGCAPNGQVREIARWPALLVPWAEVASGGAARQPDWHPACKPPAAGGAPLTIAGLAPDARLRPRPGERSVSVSVSAVGAEGELHWLLDGVYHARGRPGQTLRLRLTQAGAHRLSAFDARGRYAQVSFELLRVPSLP